MFLFARQAPPPPPPPGFPTRWTEKEEVQGEGENWSKAQEEETKCTAGEDEESGSVQLGVVGHDRRTDRRRDEPGGLD